MPCCGLGYSVLFRSREEAKAALVKAIEIYPHYADALKLRAEMTNDVQCRPAR
jgi:hypothetical protein